MIWITTGSREMTCPSCHQDGLPWIAPDSWWYDTDPMMCANCSYWGTFREFYSPFGHKMEEPW